MNESPKMKFNSQGLIPAIVQDASTGEVLMLAWMNQESLDRTLASGHTWFYSRSRGKFWMKGESSGHTQKVESVLYDCDADTLLVKVTQTGAACHEGYRSCFFRKLKADGTYEVVAERMFDPAKVYGDKSGK
jgi:phosphoribosyl-AMP cyclohydrolase